MMRWEIWVASVASFGTVQCSSGNIISSTDSGLEASTDSGSEAGLGPPALHRSSAGSCSTDPRPAGDVDLDAGAVLPSSQCHNDGECDAGLNGRCQWITQYGINFPSQFPLCSYDECFSDQDCPSPHVCDCRGDRFYTWTDANRCLLDGNCRVDSDCTSGFCSPAPAPSGAVCSEGYFCHEPQDTCSNDSDCPNGQSCTSQDHVDPHYWSCSKPCLDGGA